MKHMVGTALSTFKNLYRYLYLIVIKSLHILVYLGCFKVGCYNLLDIHDPEVAIGYHVACMATWYIM